MRRSLGFILVATLTTASLSGNASTAPRNVVEPGLLQVATPVDVIARFTERVPADIVHVAGFTVLYRFNAVPAVYGHARPDAIRTLARRSDLAYLEANKAIEYELDTATRATRARDVWAPLEGEPLRDGDGNIVDGTGVGIAIVDTGLDGTHPDFQTPGKVGGNYQVTPAGLIASPYTTNVNGGHGTHVAGIAAGNGAVSDGLYKGVAPGATVYAFNMFLGPDGTTAIILPTIAFDWILTEGPNQQPPIRVVNNSWRCMPRVCANAFNPNQLHNVLASRLAASGVVVSWSAGNDGGKGSVAMTNAASINPTPGIISVANYKDERTTFETGVRDNRVSATSSRGDSSDPRTWPDLAAPGSDVFSTWAAGVQLEENRLVSRNPATGQNSYYLLTGTSMAAPHVAGIAALMLQMNPSLAAGDVEYILKATADELPNAIGYLRADPAHPWNGSNYAEGHGLVDAKDAVLEADGFAGIPSAPDPEPIPLGFLVSTPGIDVTRTLYLTDELGMTDTYPATLPAPRHQRIREFLTYQSTAVDEAMTIDAVRADLFMGTLHEYAATTHASLQIRVVVERVTESGERTTLGSTTGPTWNTPPGAPVHRQFDVFFDEPSTIAAGDAIAVGIVLESNPDSDPAVASDVTLTEGGFIVYTGRPSASRIGLGTTVAHPEASSDAACRTRSYCAVVGGTLEVASVACGNTFSRLRWHGPAGSVLLHTCDARVTTCVVPGMPGDPDGDCVLDVEPIHPQAAARDGQCAYRIPDGSIGGYGRCESLSYINVSR